MKNYLPVALIFFLSNCSSEKSLSSAITYSNLKDFYFQYDSILNNIQQKNEIALIVGSVNFNSGPAKHYYILAKQKGVWHFFDYSTKNYRVLGEPGYSFTEKNITQSRGDSILLLFKTIKFWSITPKNDGMCFDEHSNPPLDSLRKYSCSIHDVPTSQIVTFYDHKIINVKQYYAPATFQSCCPSDSNRIIFIKAYNAVWETRKTY